jgi:hypothetical protein
MIEMSCPRCGAGGRVPRDKVNSRLVCKKCLQVFHLGPSLHPVIGEPPAPKDVPKTRAPREPRERIELEMPGLEGLTQKLARIKVPDAKVLGVTAAVLLVVAFFWWLFSKQSVEQRSQSLAAAIRNLDMNTISAMALPGTEMEAMTWVGDVSKQYVDLKLALGNLEPGVQVSVQYNTDGTAQALMTFGREGAVTTGPLSVEQASDLSPSAGGKKSLDLVVAFAKDTWGTWRLDGKRTADTVARAAR